MMCLKYEAEMRIPKLGLLSGRERKQVGILDFYETLIWLIKRTQKMEQRAFASSRRANNGNHFASSNFKRNLAKHLKGAIGFGKILCAEQRTWSWDWKGKLSFAGKSFKSKKEALNVAMEGIIKMP